MANKPIGSANNELGDCSPCAEQPTDCTLAISQLNNTVCSLKAQLAEMLRKYKTLQGKLVGQADFQRQIQEEISRLRRLISEFGGDTGCGSDIAETADSILACDGGTPKGLPPGANCADIIGVGGKWKVIEHGLAWHPLPTKQRLGTADGTFTDLNGYDDIKKIGCAIWALVAYTHFLTGTSSAAGGTNILSMNSQVVAGEYILDGGGDCMVGQAMVPLTEKKIVISAVYAGSGSVLETSIAYDLLGYFA